MSDVLKDYNLKDLGGARLNKDILKTLENYEKKHSYYSMTIKETVSDNVEVEIPFNFTVGNDEFEIYYNNEYLIREKNDSDKANYKEIGEIGSTSNKVKFGWNLLVGDVLVFIKKGVVENEENES